MIPWRRVAVLGVGLIGGSFAAALRARGLAARLVGHGPSAPLREALALGLIDEASASVAEAVRDADLVMLAAPIPALPTLLAEAAPALAPGAIVSDCASTKRGVIEAARDSLGPAFGRFVAGHPIAGSEHHGPGAARAGLFEGAKVMICPVDGTDAAACARIEATWQALGARAIRMGPDEHDAIYAEVSHWPHAVAFALCAAIADGRHAEPALGLAGAGLRDTTRIAASSAELWVDILLDNRQAVLECARAFNEEIDAIGAALADGDRPALLAVLARASQWRRRLG